MGYAMVSLINLDHPILGILLLAAWLIGMVNCLWQDE
jgi:hypothetical protein